MSVIKMNITVIHHFTYTRAQDSAYLARGGGGVGGPGRARVPGVGAAAVPLAARVRQLGPQPRRDLQVAGREEAARIGGEEGGRAARRESDTDSGRRERERARARARAREHES